MLVGSHSHIRQITGALAMNPGRPLDQGWGVGVVESDFQPEELESESQKILTTPTLGRPFVHQL